MSQTSLLPPATAVRLVWARTGAFSKDEHSQISATLTEAALKDIKDRAEQDDTEKKYALSALATMDASYRSLDIMFQSNLDRNL